MKMCLIEILDFKNVKFHGLQPETRRKCVNRLKFKDPKARYLPSVRMGRWDGTVSFCTIGGVQYIPFLSILMEIIQNDGYDFDIKDNRPDIRLKFDPITKDFLSYAKWTGGQFAGDSIELRDHQVNAVNALLQHDTATIEAATSAGKCQTYDTLIDVEIENSDFKEFLNKTRGNYEN